MLLDKGTEDGSSPRMRGTPLLQHHEPFVVRIIPAHAGNSEVVSAVERLDADHPRACGELGSGSPGCTSASGSSPRMRGTRATHPWEETTPRIIPAHAGNSFRGASRWSRSTDHPRACGELTDSADLSIVLFGSSPRMRGTRSQRFNHLPRHRIIPAHAGNSRARGGPQSPSADHPRACGELGLRDDRPGLADLDHPRACGELSPPASDASTHNGSSPRMRGTPIQVARRGQRGRIIPAHAGNSNQSAGHPPRPERIIPAHAGNSRSRSLRKTERSDHPRACGELVSRGVLPRPAGRIIPAHAGNS